jgi:chloride channel protein, CIC family
LVIGTGRLSPLGICLRLIRVVARVDGNGPECADICLQVARDVSDRTYSARAAQILQRISPTETQVLVVTGVVVGLGAGVGAVIFRYLINGFMYVFFDVVRPALAGLLGPAAVVPLPALGGLLFGPLIYFFAREARGHGVPEVMLAVAQRGGRIRPAVVVVKALASALCIGSGGSVGREGPIVQIGSALGSTVGQALRMSDDRIRTLVACGAAGGIAATFNAPIAGVFFALEVILGEFNTRAFGIVVISSVTASVIGRAAFGDVPSFPVPAYDLVNVGELGLYALLAVLAGAVGIGFTRTLYWFEDAFDAIRIPEYLKPVPGGLALGLLGMFLPQVFGVGYPPMSQALGGEFGLGLLLVLVVAKILAVSLTIGSGGSGGVFAPSLFIGAMLGTAFGTAANMLFPGFTAPAGAYGLVGMAAVFSGAARAPITAVIILFELTGDYRIILPLMGAVVVSTLISEALSRDTIYTLKLRRRGIDLRGGRDVDLMRTVPVAHAMSARVPSAPSETLVSEAVELLDQTGDRALVVLDESGALDAIATFGDLETPLLDNKPGLTVGEVASRPVVTVFADESLSQAMHKMGVRDVGQLPVVGRGVSSRVLGMLRRADIVRAYSHAMLNRIESQTRRPILPAELRGTRIVEIPVEAGSILAGQSLLELGLPPDMLVVAIERHAETIIPRGDTQLQAGDCLQILVRDEAIAGLHEHLASVGRLDSTAEPSQTTG